MNVIIPSDSPELARRLLQSIADLDPDARATYIIVTRDDVAMASALNGIPLDIRVESYGKEAQFIYARSVNIGVSRYQNDGDFMLLNDDAELESPRGIQEMMNLLANVGQKVGIVSAGIKGVAGVEEQQAGIGEALRIVAGGQVSFVAVGISSECMRQVGPLDERFDAYGWEDMDYCTRARQEGYEVAVFDGCVFSHRKPHSSFIHAVNSVSEAQMHGELIYHKKHGKLTTNPVFVIGASQAGASVVAGMLGKMGIDMADPHPAHVLSTTQYYRDPEFNRLIKGGPAGLLLYGFRRSGRTETRWGVRLWPSPEYMRDISQMYPNATYVLVSRNADATIKSLCMHRGMKKVDAEERYNVEHERFLECKSLLSTGTVLDIDFEDVAMHTTETALSLAREIGWPKGIEAAVEVVKPRFYHYHRGGKLVEHGSQKDFGKIAVGIRASNPHPGFVSSLAALMRDGLRENDILLPVQSRVPSHIAANELMRAFMSTDADTLLMLDDDMSFSQELLSQMRDNPQNHPFGVVSALATQRLHPPRAIVLREDEQPPLPDSTDGLYYDLIVDEVDITKTLKVGATGFAFTLIRREVLEAMTSEHGVRHTWYVQWGRGGMGEDVWFCQQASRHGFEIGVDCAAHVGHIGSVVYGYDDFDAWRKSEKRSGAGIGLGDLKQIVGESIKHLPEEVGEKAISLLGKIERKDN